MHLRCSALVRQSGGLVSIDVAANISAAPKKVRKSTVWIRAETDCAYKPRMRR